MKSIQPFRSWRPKSPGIVLVPSQSFVSGAFLRGLLAIVGSYGLAPSCRPAPEIPKSQHARVEQHVGRVVVTIEYNRPVARGRRLFGGIVPFGEPWNPGADAASTIDFSGDVAMEGRLVPAGTYSIWVIPGVEKWTFILSRAASVFHVPYPEGKDQLRLSLESRTGPYMETLGFYFPMVDADSALMQLHWGETVLPIHLRAR